MVNLNEVLDAKSFDRLIVKRNNLDCYLIVDVNNIGHTYLKSDGRPMRMRHVWQWKKWLNDKFNIVDVEFNEL